MLSSRRSIWLLLALLAAGLSAAEDRVAAPNIETIVQRMAQARTDNQAILRAYTVTRNYTLIGKDRKDSKAQVLVQISFVPPSAKKFVIQKSSGTGFGERAVRQMLEHETDIVKNHDSTELSLANYSFRLLREEPCRGQRCFVLAITPRRQDKTLLVGRIWVDTATYLLHRTEGEPAKGPSWWLRDSSIVFTYGNVDGMWLQTASESTANVRFVGRYTMLSQDIEYTLSKSGNSGTTHLLAP
ncbi:MAG: hypothetical protein WDO18_10975 [Acidobacteriota bacterium]